MLIHRTHHRFARGSFNEPDFLLLIFSLPPTRHSHKSGSSYYDLFSPSHSCAALLIESFFFRDHQHQRRFGSRYTRAPEKPNRARERFLLLLRRLTLCDRRKISNHIVILHAETTTRYFEVLSASPPVKSKENEERKRKTFWLRSKADQGFSRRIRRGSEKRGNRK